LLTIIILNGLRLPSFRSFDFCEYLTFAFLCCSYFPCEGGVSRPQTMQSTTASWKAVSSLLRNCRGEKTQGKGILDIFLSKKIVLDLAPSIPTKYSSKWIFIYYRYWIALERTTKQNAIPHGAPDSTNGGPHPSAHTSYLFLLSLSLSLASWFLGSLVPWFSDSMVGCWIGSLVPWVTGN
jgi:hypothetical protein